MTTAESTTYKAGTTLDAWREIALERNRKRRDMQIQMRTRDDARKVRQMAEGVWDADARQEKETVTVRFL